MTRTWARLEPRTGSWLRRHASATLRAAGSIEVPRRLRAFVRARETSLVVLAAAIGGIAGLVVMAMSSSVQLLHVVFFGLIPGERLSAQDAIDQLAAVTVPVLGGLALGTAGLILAHRRPGREIDPIEANALHGGRMSLRGSFVVAAQTVWSSGVGASVGLEAGYTQLSSGIASFIGRAFRLRRGDLRVLVGCGSAGAIAGAFGAPLAGAFYAFELIIGSYSVASLASVAIAALVGFLVTQKLAGMAPLAVFTGNVVNVTGRDLVFAGVLGLIGAIAGIALMRGVALCESLFTRWQVPAFLRPAIGGLGVGLCAMISPQVMSSGHGALHLTGVINRPIGDIATVLALKAVASMLSLGSGFRGGLFFSSLLLGALAGHLFAGGVETVAGILLDPRAYAIIGMGALSAAVIGAPLTMTFIALETTRDLQLTAAVLIAVVVSVLVTRETFGYSFATWRFHLRGETIRSAADVGWLRDLTVERMMRRDLKTVPADLTVAAFREAFPLGSQTRVVALDHEGRYAGIVVVPDVYAAELAPDAIIGTLLHNTRHVLLPTMTIKSAVEAFDQAEAEALAVVDSKVTRRVMGTLTEAHALRRYAEEFELRRRELIGEQ